MSILKYREALKDLPGGAQATMTCADGGKFNVYKLGDIELKIPAGYSPDMVREEYKKKLLS